MVLGCGFEIMSIYIKICDKNVAVVLCNKFLSNLKAWNIYSVKTESIVCKGVPARHLLLRQPPLDPVCPPFWKSLLPLRSFLFHPLRHFRPTPHLQASSDCLNPTNQPSLVQANIKRLILPVQLLLSIKNQFLIF